MSAVSCHPDCQYKSVVARASISFWMLAIHVNQVHTVTATDGEGSELGPKN